MRIAVAVAVLWLSMLSAHAESYWLWAIDGRFEVSKKPCAHQGAKSNVAHMAILKWIDVDTFVDVSAEGISLRRGKRRSTPDQRLEIDGKPIAIWYQGNRTWVVSLLPSSKHPALAVVTLVMEHNAKREGAPKCYERWIAPVSP